MVTRYPAAIDTVFTLKPILDGQPVSGGSVEQLREAIIAIEDELGVKPSAVYSTVRARLDSIENIVGNLRIIELDQDLGGTLEDPHVIGIHGRPISTVPPQPGEAYVWDGLAWTPGSLAANVHFGGDLRGDPVTQRTVGINTIPVRHGSFGFDQGYLKAQYIMDFSSCTVFDGTNLWVLSYNNDLVKINVATPSIVEYIPLPNTYFGSDHQAGLAFDGTYIYANVFGFKTVGPSTVPTGILFIIRKSDMAIVGRNYSEYNNGKNFGVAVNADDVFVASGDQSLTITAGTDNTSRIDRYSLTTLLANYPGGSSTPPLASLLPSVGNAYHGGFLYHNGFLFVTSFTVNPQIYKIAPNTMTVVDSYAPGEGTSLTNLVFANGGLWTGLSDSESQHISKFNPNDLASGTVSTLIEGAAGFGQYISVHAGRWLTVTHGNSSFIETIDTTPGAEAAYDIDLEDGGLYGVSYSDGTYVWTCNRSSGPLGVGIYAMHGDNFPNINIDHFFGGSLEIVYSSVASGGGGAPATVLTYRPSGGSNGPVVFSEWSTLISTRQGIDGPVTILIDDRFESPALVDVGVWDLRKNTKIVGISDHMIDGFPQRPKLRIPIGASIINPSEFENVHVFVSKWDENIGGLWFDDPSEPSSIILRDAHLQDGSNGLNEGKAIWFSSTVSNTIEMYGSSELENDDNYNPIFVNSGCSITVKVYDSSRVRDGLFNSDDPSLATATIEMFSDGAFLDDRTGNIVLNINYYTPGDLVYQPFGGGGGTRRVLTSWTNIMSARSTIPGHCTIIIDDSVNSLPFVEPGEWDLTNTTIKGKGVSVNDPTLPTQLEIQSGAHLFNVYKFENLNIINNQFSNPSIETPQDGTVEFRDCILQHGSAGQSLILAHGGTINFTGKTHLVSNNNTAILENAYSGDLVINLKDETFVDGYCIKINYFGFPVTINVTGRAFFTTFQPQIFIVITINQANLVQSGPYDKNKNPNIIVYRPQFYDATVATGSEGSTNLATLSQINEGNPGDFPDWSAILAGRDHTITGNSDFSVIVGGEDNHLFDCSYSIIGGHGISMNFANECVAFTRGGGAGGSWCGVFGGASNFADGTAAGVFCGTNGHAGGSGGVVLGGDQGNANAFGSVTLGGEQNQATGDYSVAMGNNGRAWRTGQFAQATGPNRQFGRLVIDGVSNNTTPTEMRLTMEEGQTYAFRITTVASRENNFTGTPEGRAVYIRTVLAHLKSGVPVIDTEDPTFDFNVGTDTELWTYVLSTDTSDLVATFTGSFFASASVVNVTTTFEWTEVDENF